MLNVFIEIVDMYIIRGFDMSFEDKSALVKLLVIAFEVGCVEQILQTAKGDPRDVQAALADAVQIIALRAQVKK